MSFLIVFFVVLPLQSVFAQYQTNGSCQNFLDCRGNVEITNEKLVGVWYLESSIPYFYQVNQKCTVLNYTAQPGPRSIRFDKTEIDIDSYKKRETFGIFNYTVDGLLDLDYTDLKLPFRYTTLELTSEYWVLVSCFECGFFNNPPGIYAYIFTKIPYSPCDAKAKARESLKLCGIPESALVEHDQSNCKLC